MSTRATKAPLAVAAVTGLPPAVRAIPRDHRNNPDPDHKRRGPNHGGFGCDHHDPRHDALPPGHLPNRIPHLGILASDGYLTIWGASA